MSNFRFQKYNSSSSSLLNHLLINLSTFRACCYQKLHKWTEAYFDYCFAIQMEPETGSYYSMRGLCLGKLQKVDMAIEDLTLACKYEAIPHNYLTRSTLHMDNGDFQSALWDCNKALEFIQRGSKMKEDDYEKLKSLASFRRAQVFHEIKMYEEEINDLIVVINNDAQSVAPRIMLARAYKMSGDLRTAEKEVDLAILMKPDHSGYMERGDIRFRFGVNAKSIQAIDDFTRCINMMEFKEDLAHTNNEGIRGLSKLCEDKYCSNHSRIEGTECIISTGTSIVNESPGGSPNITAVHAVYKEEALPDSETKYRAQEKRQDMVESIADIYAKRAQTVLTLDHQSKEDLNMAFADAKKASKLAPSKEEHRLLVATCLLRLQQVELAATTLREVIQMNPNNENALFNEAFCHRLHGRYKEAIDNLTKILSLKEKERMRTGEKSHYDAISRHDSEIVDDMDEYSSDFYCKMRAKDQAYILPVNVIYETRGILFHQGKAFRLALSDLAKAILLNPEKPLMYFLRADCYKKLGNYEKAVRDLQIAEEKGFKYIYSLLICRGTIWRCLGNSEQAEVDFKNALELLVPLRTDKDIAADNLSFVKHISTNEFDENSDERIGLCRMFDTVDRYSQLRALSLHAICLYDLKRYNESFLELQKALMILRYLQRISVGAPSTSSVSSLYELNVADARSSSVKDCFLRKRREKDSLSGRSKLSISDYNRTSENPQFKSYKMSYDQVTFNTKTFEWSVSYHIAGCLYSLYRFEESIIYLKYILHEISDYCPDEFMLGAALFFYGIQSNIIGRWKDAEDSLRTCLCTLWTISSVKNISLCRFGLGKALQGGGKHEEAVNEFTDVINRKSKDAHAHFRRAWSYKAIKLFHEAANDFETAKQLKPNDPNFSISYSKVQKIEYLGLDSEPDLMENFPTLLSGDRTLW